MKRNLIAISVLGLAALAARADEWNKEWPVSGTPEVHVSAGDSSITVESASSHNVEAKLITRGWTIGNSGVRVIEHQNGDRIDIEIREPNTHFNFGNHSCHLTVRVPREVTGYIHTGDGSIKLNGLHGSVRADTGDGSIEADDLDGMLQARSGDGSVHVRGRFDGLQVHTSDGSVDLQALKGSRMKEDWSLHTGDGSVRLTLPRDLAADLDVHTGDGAIRTNMELTINGRQSEHELRGKLNGGGPQLAVSTGDGSVQIDSI